MLATNNKYAFLLPLTILALIEEPTKASKMLKVFILKTVKPKKLASKIN